jgi:hypothetical protein
VAPETPLSEVALVTVLREATAPLFRVSRGGIGLADYDVYGWQGRHRHIVLLAGTDLINPRRRP